MEETMLAAAVKEGIWAVCFVALLIYVIRENKAREKAYQKTISALHTEVIGHACENLRLTEGISQDVDNLDNKIHRVTEKVDTVDRKVDHVIDKLDAINNRI